MPYFNIVAQTTENTVVTSYTPVAARLKLDEYYCDKLLTLNKIC